MAAAPRSSAQCPLRRLDGFIEAQAQAAGLAIEEPFPFLLVGLVARADWHVIDGSKIESGVHGHEAHVRSAVRGTLSDQPVRLIGFFSIKHHTIFTHHDTDTHAHLIHTEPPLTGHVDHLVLSPGAELLLAPERAQAASEHLESSLSGSRLLRGSQRHRNWRLIERHLLCEDPG